MTLLTNYHDLYFEYKTLTRINVKTTFINLHQLLLELKSNAVSLLSTLGGGSHRFIGIMLSSVAYATLVPFQSFITPANPVPLLNYGGTQYEIALARTEHEEALNTFQEYQLVQRALVQQVIEVIYVKYLTALSNCITGQVPSEIRALILHLFRVY